MKTKAITILVSFIAFIMSALGTVAMPAMPASVPSGDTLATQPVVWIEGQSTGCQGQIVTLTAQVLGDNIPSAYTYTWFKNGTAIIPAEHGQQLTFASDSLKTTITHFTVEITLNGCDVVSSPVFDYIVDTLRVNVWKNTPDSVCLGSSVYFYYNYSLLAGGNIGHEWVYLDDTAFGENYFLFADSIGWQVVELKAWTLNGCLVIASDSVYVRDPNGATANTSLTMSLNYDTICEHSQITATATGTLNAGESIQWYKDGLPFGTPSVLQYIIDEPSAGMHIYGFEVLSTAACGMLSSGILTDTIYVLPVPTVSIGGDALVCMTGANNVVLYAAVNDTAGYNSSVTYTWRLNNLNVGTGDTLKQTKQMNATPYVYTVTASYTNGCQITSDPYYVYVNDSIVLLISTNANDTVCQGTEVIFTAEVGGLNPENIAFAWTTSGQATPVLGYQKIFTTTINADSHFDVSASTLSGCTANASVDIYVYGADTSTFPLTLSDNKVCQGAQISLSTQLKSGKIYNWYRNGTLFAGGLNINSTSDFPVCGIDSTLNVYTLQVSDPSGCNGFTSDTSVMVMPSYTVSINGVHSVCANGTLTLDAIINGGINDNNYQYTWSWRDNTNTLQTTTTAVPYFVTPNTLPVNLVTNPYYFTVTATRTDGSSCTATSAPFEINILAAPVATVTVNHTDVCAGGQLIFTANVNPVGTYNYQWYVDNVLVGYQSTLIMNNLATGAHSVKVYAIPLSAALVCGDTSNVITVTVHNDPVIASVTSNYTDICIGGMVTLNVNTITIDAAVNNNDFTYQWTVNGSVISGAADSVLYHFLSNAGVYNFRVKMTQNDDLGCNTTWSQSIAVTVAPQPTVVVSRTDTFNRYDVCNGGTIELQANVINSSPAYGVASYRWYEAGNFTGDTTNPFYDTLLIAGHQYLYNAIVSFTGEGCSAATTNFVTVNTINKPQWGRVVAATPNSNGHLCTGEKVDLQAVVLFPIASASAQWYYIYGTDTGAVDGGTGLISWDLPDSTGYYDYLLRYIAQGSGCQINDTMAEGLVNGHAIEVHALPTAVFTQGDSSSLCANENTSVVFEITFTGVQPFYFDFENTTTGDIQRYGPINNTVYNITVSPTATTVYRIINLMDAHCSADALFKAEAVVFVTDIVIVTNFQADCEITAAETAAGYHIVELPIEIKSGSPTMYSVTFDDPAYSSYNVSGGIVYHGSTPYIEIHLPFEPGDYALTITIDGCIYHTTGTSLFTSASGGNDIVEQRWDDVLVVNNNPAKNGGYRFTSFNWYRNGQAVNGNQSYQESGGLNGTYYVVLSGTKTLSNGTVVNVTLQTCPITPVSSQKSLIYPAPAPVHTPITVVLPFEDAELEGAVLNIYDAKGAIVYTNAQLKQRMTIPGLMAPGVYVGQVKANKKVETLKFIISQH